MRQPNADCAEHRPHNPFHALVEPGHRRRSRWLGICLLVLGVQLALASGLGPLGIGAIRYRVTDLMMSQLKGADAVSLLVVAPGCIALGLGALRGRRAVAPLALGPATYTLYMVSEVVVAPDYVGISGNIERFFPFFLSLFLIAMAIVITAWTMTAPAVVPALSPRRGRFIGAVLVVTAVLIVVGRYVPALSAVMSGHAQSQEYRAGSTIFWMITLQDLGFVVPAMIVTGIGTWRGSPSAVRVRSAVVGWSALVPIAVVAMAIFMYMDADGTASLSGIAVLMVFAVVMLVPAVLCYAPLRR